MLAKHTVRSKEDFEADIKSLLEKLRVWSIPDEALDRVHDAGRASLTEVKALTEYEDGKVSRLLTIIAFLSAVVAAVFTKFANDFSWLLPAATYVTFLLYVVLVTWSVWSILGAIRPQFVMPATWTDGGRTGLPTSMIFYKGILDVRPTLWGDAFIDLAASDGKRLKQYYAKNYIVETYLIAEKVAVKLAALGAGLSALRGALVILLLFFILFGATVSSLDPTRSSPTSNAAILTSAQR